MFGGAQSTGTTETPLTGISIQSSANGLPIPLIYGTTRVTPNLLWYGDFVAVPHKEKSGGKGGDSGGGGVSYTYTASYALAIGEGPALAITKVWIDKTQEAASAKFSLFLGTVPQSPWAHLATNHPGEALAYPGIVYAASAGYDLGTSSSLPNHNFEVSGKCVLGGVLDADPRDIVVDLLTNATAGVPNAPPLGGTTAYSNYCRAAGLLLSPCYSEASPAAAMLADIFRLTNTGVYFSEGVVKLVPYGDATITGNGVTFTPALTPVANLNDDDFLGDNSDDPVRIERNAVGSTGSTTADAYNQVTVEYLNRASAYQPETVTRDDQAAIDTYGLRPLATITAHQIASGTVAGAVADLILQRSVYVRAQYLFTLGWQWCFLEPTDLITITDAALGLTLYPVRILSIEEDESGTLAITAEDAPPGVSSHVVAPVPQSGGYSVDYNAPAGSVSAVCLFEPPFILAEGTGLEVWAGVSGPSGPGIWGGCHVWVSYDGTTYQLLDTITQPARVGHLTAPINTLSTGPLAVQLDGQGGQLLAASAEDAAALNTLFYVGGDDAEFMAYQGATLTATNAYSLADLVRAAYGSAAAPHNIGDPFIRLDDTLVKSGSLGLDLIGQTLRFKFQSFNVWGGGLEDLAGLPVYDYVVAGIQATGNPVTGLAVSAITGSAVLTQLSWDASPGVDHYEIDQSGDGINWQRTGETKATTWADSSLYGAATRYRVAAVRARAGTWSSTVFLNIGYVGMWNANPAAPMWNANPSTPMWSA